MRSKVFRHAGLALCAAAYVLAPCAATAKLTDDQRKALAHSFVDKLKSLYEAPKQPQQIDTTGLSAIPDGQELLLQPYLKGLPFADNIYGVKHNGRAYLSFQDFIDVLYFSIKYDEDTYKGAGWFLREDWAFDIDYPARKVVSKGKTFSISDNEAYVENGALLVTPEALKQWFDIGIEPNLMAQSLKLESDYPFPVQSHNARERGAGGNKRNLNIAEYPLIETDYKWLDVSSAQVSTSTNLRKSPDRPQQRSTGASVVTQGQALKHSFYTTANMDNRNGLSGITGQMFRESAEPELLGPLHARAYYLGDIDQPNIPLLPGSRQGVGVNVTNNPLYERYDLSTTVIRGNATPGWDVELYRNGGLVSTVTVGDEGRYEFEGIQLFSGDNDFELLFFGPQGEIRREVVNMPVDQEVIAQKDDTYEFAAAFSDTQTYRKYEIDDVDQGEPDLSGRYNFLIGDVLNYVGFRKISLGGEAKNYFSSGLITTAFDTIVDANAAVDEQGEARVGMQLRRDFGDIDTSLTAEAGTDKYVISESDNPTVRQVGGAIQIPLRFLPGRRNILSGGTNYGETAEGQASQSHDIGLATQVAGLNITNALQYQTADESEDQKNYSLGVSGQAGPFFWRAGAAYELAPEKQLGNVALGLKYRIADGLTTDLDVQHQPQTNFTEYQLGANWTNDKFILSPFVNYDSEHELYTGVNMRFGLVNPPGDGLPVMTGRQVSGQGFVSAFVYLDKNGDLEFNGNDEPLPGVLVKSINISRKDTTDEKGMVLLPSLLANRQTDINVDPNTFPDPFMISKYEPRSVALKPGEIIHLEMPVQYAGELDGLLQLAKSDGTIKDAVRSRVALLPLEDNDNSTMQSEALSDGFFVFSLIPPGRYYLSVNPLDAKEYTARRPQPRLITVGYDAPVFYGQDIVMQQGFKDIDFSVLNEEEAYTLGFAPVQDRRRAAPRYLISIEKEKSSKLLSILYSFNSRKLAAKYLADLEPLKGEADAATTRYHAPSLEVAYERCGAIVGEGLPCRVETLLPPSENFAIKRKGIITTDNTLEQASGQL